MNPQQPAASSSNMGNNRNIITTIALVCLLILTLVFGGWSFSKMEDYKNNSDKKVAIAVEAAKKTQAAQLKAQFDEQSKSPNKTFHGSPTYGSLSFNYPKTWSAYVDNTGSSEPINGYFHPDQVPGLQSKTAYALRVELVSTDYAQLLQQFSSQISQGDITAMAYLPPKMQGVSNAVTGTYLSGRINNQDQTQQGKMVIIKVRDKTLEIYTDSNQYASDFNDTILGSLTFIP